MSGFGPSRPPYHVDATAVMSPQRWRWIMEYTSVILMSVRTRKVRLRSSQSAKRTSDPGGGPATCLVDADPPPDAERLPPVMGS